MSKGGAERLWKFPSACLARDEFRGGKFNAWEPLRFTRNGEMMAWLLDLTKIRRQCIKGRWIQSTVQTFIILGVILNIVKELTETVINKPFVG